MSAQQQTGLFGAWQYQQASIWHGFSKLQTQSKGEPQMPCGYRTDGKLSSPPDFLSLLINMKKLDKAVLFFFQVVVFGGVVEF